MGSKYLEETKAYPAKPEFISFGFEQSVTFGDEFCVLIKSPYASMPTIMNM